METAIKTISMEIEIKCRICGFTGPVTATREYYIDCPNCDKLVYVGRLTGMVK